MFLTDAVTVKLSNKKQEFVAPKTIDDSIRKLLLFASYLWLATVS